MADEPQVRVDYEMPSDKVGTPSAWGTYARLRVNPADLAAFIDAHLASRDALRDLADYVSKEWSERAVITPYDIRAMLQRRGATAPEAAAELDALRKALRQAADRLQGASEAMAMAFPAPEHGQETAAQLRAWADEARAALGEENAPNG